MSDSPSEQPVDLAVVNEKKQPKRKAEQFVKQAATSPFSFQEKDRRVNTLFDATATWPQQSEFKQWLQTAGNRPDFAYSDLRTVLDSVLKSTPSGLTSDQINAAIAAGVRNFDPSQSTIKLEPDVNPDLQLLAHHLLKYQVFHRGPLQDTEENKAQNAFRALEMAKTKQMLASTTTTNLNLVLPPTPTMTEESAPLQDALAALPDLNRALKGSMFGGDTYKAVFLLINQLYFDAYQRAQNSLTEKKEKEKEPPTVQEQIAEQRSFFNPAFFDLLPQMQPSTIPEGGGKAYVKNQLRINYDSDLESFDESSSSGESESEAESDEEINDTSENIFRGADKRSTFLGAAGVFAKMSSQKELLDQPTHENKRKFARLRRRIDRRARKANDKWEPRFKVITDELGYLEKKEKLIDKELEAINKEHRVLTFFADEEQTETGLGPLLRGGHKAENPLQAQLTQFTSDVAGKKAGTKVYKDALAKVRRKVRGDAKTMKAVKARLGALDSAKGRGEELYDALGTFYSDTTLDELMDLRESAGWRRKKPEVFGNLGPAAMKRYLYRADDEPPKKKRRTTKGKDD